MGFSRVIGLRVLLGLLISSGFFSVGSYDIRYTNQAARQAKIKHTFLLQSSLELSTLLILAVV
jgi:hypothetical protein